MSEILLIEDDKNTCQSIKAYFKNSNIQIIALYNGKEGFAYICKNFACLDGIILDLNLPGMNGLEICHQVRLANINIPILILTHETSTQTVVDAFDLGADDYVKKPFSISELEARLLSMLKVKKFDKEEVISSGDLRINLSERVVYKRCQRLELSRKQFDLLLFLMRNKGKVFTREQLITNVWRFDQDPYLNTVDSHISALRKQIGDPNQQILQTVFGVGYRFREE